MPKLRLSPILLVMNIALVVYGLTALLSFFTAYESSRSEAVVAAVVVSVIIYFALVYKLLHDETTLIFGKVVGGLGLLFALFFISQFAHQNYIETPALINRIGGITTVLPYLNIFIHQNSASTIINLLLPIVVALLITTKRPNSRILWVVTLIALLYAYLLTYSRGAYLGLAVALLLGLAVVGIKRLSGRQAISLIGVIVAVVVVIIVGLVLIGPRVPFVASLMGVTASRLEIYRNSLGLAGDYLFTGIGLGDTFAMVYSRYSLMIFVPLFTYTHNLFLAVLLGQGIFGLVAFIIVLIAFYSFVARVLVVVQINEIEPLFYGGLIGVTATLVHGLTDARQYVESPFNLPLLFMGMALTVACGLNALRLEAFENRDTNRSGGWWTLRIITVGSVVVLAVAAVIFNKQIIAAWYTNIGALNEIRSDSTIMPNIGGVIRSEYARFARENYEFALKIDPDYPNANRRLGNMNVDSGAYPQAAPLLEKAYAAEPNYQATTKGLGLAYTWLGRTQDAACVLNKLPNVTAMSDELVTWSTFRHEQQQDLLAAYALDTATIMNDYQQTNMDVWVLLADLYKSGGNNQLAQEWYSRVLDRDPNNTAAQEKLTALGLERVRTSSQSMCPT